MKRGSEKQGDIGKPSPNTKKVKVEKGTLNEPKNDSRSPKIKYAAVSKIIKDLNVQLTSKGEIEEFSSTKIKHLNVEEPLHELKVIEPRWRTVEVAASFVEGEPAGGVFILRESGTVGDCLMYEYFPIEGKSELFAEASALYESMTKINSPGFEYKSNGVVAFLFESAELLECLTNSNFPMDDFVKPVIENCKDLLQKKRGEFGFKQWPGMELFGAFLKAKEGRVSQKRFRWDWNEKI